MDRLNVRVLVVNAGSSTVRIRLLDARDALVHRVDLPADRGRPEPGALEGALGELGGIDAVGHRVVHGGQVFRGPVRVDAEVLDELERLIALAPLHQPPALAAMRATRAALPDVPAVACFDTAFHTTLPSAASTYAVPQRWRTEFGVRRYGFHGLAHEWAARRVATLVGPGLRTVVAHLGSGASLCAVEWAAGRPRSVDTTMGFTPTSGLVMASRSGDLDPTVPLWLVETGGLTTAEVTTALQRDSGLMGLAGSGDMRAVLAAEQDCRPDAVLAVEVWLHRLRAGIASMAAALGGLDVLVFSGGVGEHAAQLRGRAVDGLGFLGLTVDAATNESAPAEAETDVSASGSTAHTVVIHSREDLVIAEQVRGLLGAPTRTSPALSACDVAVDGGHDRPGQSSATPSRRS